MGEPGIMAVYVSIDRFRNEYRAILKYKNGTRLFRRLGITPSPGVTHIDQEDPRLARKVWKAVSILTNELGARGADIASGGVKFGAAMKEFLKWREQHRNNENFKNHSRCSVERFGKLRLDAISRQDVAAWIEELASEYSHYTVRNVIDPPKQLYNWLSKNEEFKGKNPFTGHEWKAEKNVQVPKPYISTQEWALIRGLIANDPITAQAITLAYYTGLRPSEVYRIRPEDIDHAALTLCVRETKTRQGTRYIAIPRALSEWARGHNWRELSQNTVQHRLIGLKKEHPALSDLCMASFKKNFSAIMEEAGAPHDSIDAHQGRFQSSVLAKHYLRDKMRAVKLMRQYVTKVFDGDDSHIKGVPAPRPVDGQGSNDMWVVKNGTLHRGKKPANMI